MSVFHHGSVVFVFECFGVSVSQCFSGSVFQSFNVSMLQCSFSVLHCSSVSLYVSVFQYVSPLLYQSFMVSLV